MLRQYFVFQAVILFLISGPATASAAVGNWVQRAYAQLAELDTLPIPDQPVFASGVKQPVLSYLINQLDNRFSGVITSNHLKAAVDANPQESRFAHTIFSEIRRAPMKNRRQAFAQIVMPGLSRVTVPYSFLGYHPGTIICSESVVLEEWSLGEFSLRDAWHVDSREYKLSDVMLWAILDGTLYLDVDGWLDKLLGGKLDDARLIGGVLFTYEGTRYALAMGYNDKGYGQYGALDLLADKVHTSSPPALKVVARNMRLRVIQRLKERSIDAWWEQLGKDKNQ